MDLEPAAPSESLIALRQQCEVQVQTARPRNTRFPKPPPRRATEIAEFLTGLGVPYSSNGNDYLIQCPSGTHTDEKASFSIKRDSGVYHCFGCEISGHWEDCKRVLRRVHQTRGDDTDDYGAVAETIFTTRQRKDRQDLRKDFEINREVLDLILAHLNCRGRFYTDLHKAYFFFQREKRLITIHVDDDGYRLLMHRYGINPTEKIYRWIVEAIKNEALERGQKTTVHRLAYYDSNGHRAYVFNHDNGMYRIAPDEIELVDNGTDGVLFVTDSRAQPFRYRLPQDARPWFREVISTKINFSDDVLTREERIRVFELWFYALFFESVMPTKPILAFIGPKGSGKSMTLRRICQGDVVVGGLRDVGADDEIAGRVEPVAQLQANMPFASSRDEQQEIFQHATATA